MADGKRGAGPQPTPRPAKAPRREQRTVMPFPGGAIRVEISPPGGETVLHGNLWDLSHDGCCVVVDGLADELVDSNCGLTIKDPNSGTTLEALAQLEWCDDTIKNCFCGFRFVMPVQLPPGTFLDDYLPERSSPPPPPEDTEPLS